ncbi:molybdopterin synthase [Natronomonas marina]|jgi:molybdopterin synthase catalytic subunit|uniref:molybdopterin synthase n=1 Tax=Natronomonas marina TaxID=2961939 RepID=UPI0020C9A537|nr:molybdopterin synthase [Natronomonas marina]
MYVFAVLGEAAEAGLERLLAALDGRVGVVRTAAGDGGTTAVARADTEYVLDDGWRASGTDLSVPDALERLAPDHEYAAVVGVPDVDAPRIVVGGETEEAAVHAEGAERLDVEAAVEAIHGTEPFETLESLVAAVRRAPEADRAGAVATFTGRVRAKDGPDDDRTRYLEFEKYDGVAERTMRTIETELEDREGVLDVRLHHRTGRVDAGEDIVFVVVLAGHRREAFRAVEDGIDRLKDEVPLFKKEVTDSETFWVHERD